MNQWLLSWATENSWYLTEIRKEKQVWTVEVGDLRNSVLDMLHVRGQIDTRVKMWNRQLEMWDELRAEFQAGNTHVEITGMEQNEVTTTVAENKTCPGATLWSRHFNRLKRWEETGEGKSGDQPKI